MKIEILDDIDACRAAWQKYWPVKGLFDLWPVRDCFHNVFTRPLFFLLGGPKGKAEGFLPLCWNADSQNYVLFPGETWQGKTWLEQNRLIANTAQAVDTLLQSVPGPLHLRYLEWCPLMEAIDGILPDETGYLFYPAQFDFRMDNFWRVFPGKSRKKIVGEIEKIKTKTLSFRFNRLADLESLFQLNLNAFGENSYFYDDRFHRSFERLAAYLWDAQMLRITTIRIGKKIAAVDMGAIFNGSYTLLAGGTNPDFPGIAKAINLHHLEWSCRKRFDVVDFLCGDFNWKHRFRLTPRPLFTFTGPLPVQRYASHQYQDRALAWA